MYWNTHVSPVMFMSHLIGNKPIAVNWACKTLVPPNSINFSRVLKKFVLKLEYLRKILSSRFVDDTLTNLRKHQYIKYTINRHSLPSCPIPKTNRLAVAVRTLANYADQFLRSAPGICNRCNLRLVIVTLRSAGLTWGTVSGLRFLCPVIWGSTHSFWKCLDGNFWV